MSAAAVFAYGSLASPESASETLGRPIGELTPATLTGWSRAWTVARDNRGSEKTFALADGSLPDFCLGLNLEPDREAQVSGVLVGVTAGELGRLDDRELRYRRVDVTASVALPGGSAPRFARIEAFIARPEHHRPEPPANAIVIESYVRAVEAAFAAHGEAELERFRATTAPVPDGVPVVAASLVRDAAPAGNPRAW